MTGFTFSGVCPSLGFLDDAVSLVHVGVVSDWEVVLGDFLLPDATAAQLVCSVGLGTLTDA